MSIDVEKNKKEILAALNDVLSDKTKTDWVLLGYEGLTNTLRLFETGDGGIEEMAEELHTSKIMYAVVRVSDPKTSRNKNVLINWQGESAPNLRKGVCARHLPEVKRLLKGVHITVNARNEDEVESLLILSAVAKASATDYNFTDRSEMPERNAPVKVRVDQFIMGHIDGSPGTNYKRTNPQSEINSNSRNKFWELQEAEEKIRKQQEIKRKEEETKKLENERINREVVETRHREKLNKERNTRINSEKRAEEAATARTSPIKSWGVNVEEQQNDDVERAKRADHMRMQRKKEAESLIGKKTCEKRSMFESSFSGRISMPKSETNSLPNNDISPQGSSSAVPKKNVGKRWPPIKETTSEPTVPNKSVPGKIAEWKPIQKQDNNTSFSPKQETSSIMSINHQNAFLPQSQLNESFHKETTTTSNGDHEERKASPEQMIVHTNGMKNDEVGMTWEAPIEESMKSPLKHSPEYYPVTCEIDGVEYQLLPEHGLCARALYDYQAADETEISFDPGDIITNIDQIDVGWWQGIGPSAKFGLFPANYVELINVNNTH